MTWQIRGEGVLTALFDLTLLAMMPVLLPTKFMILLINTPIHLSGSQQ